MNPQEQALPPSRLDSWKDIARHLGRDVSTVMRWERERGLPVHRAPGGKRSGVFAFTGEIDAWLAQHPEPAEPETAADTAAPPAGQAAGRRRLWVAVAVLLLAGTALAVKVLPLTAPAVAEVRIEGTELRAQSADGALVWTHRIEAANVERPSGRWTHFGDLDGDGESEVVIVVKVQQTSGQAVVDQMLAFSHGGTLRWTHVPETRLRFGDGVYGPPWASEDLIAFDANGERRLAWAVRHYTWWPSMLLVLDRAGAERGRFVHSGWIRQLAVSQDGRALLVAGVANASQSHFVAVLDPARVSGRSPENPGTAFACLECGDAGPLQYFLLPRGDVSGQAVFPPVYAPAIQTFPDGSVQLRVSENSEPSPAEILYEFSSPSTPHRARFTDRYWDWHNRLKAERRLNHGAETCPLSGRLDVRHWTPAGGWQLIGLPSH